MPDPSHTKLWDALCVSGLVLAEMAGIIGDQQVRNRGTIGGSVAHADPGADYTTLMLLLGARFTAAGGKGQREIPVGRLVVDTGLHAKGWTRQQAIDYGIEASEVERYVVNPGQACAYMLGQLKLVELRDNAQKALGSRFSPKAFHNAVLMTGTVPLPLLEKQVVEYILSVSRAN